MNLNSTTKAVREAYGKITKQNGGCGCGCSCNSEAEDYAKGLGYTSSELSQIPAEANLALSCGNPTALAGLKEGETVLDLGSGAGFDCFLAASKVGARGRVIGVDMTPEMIEKAREIAAKDNFDNVEFRLGEIENLPAADNSVDVVISNCVINLTAELVKSAGLKNVKVNTSGNSFALDPDTRDPRVREVLDSLEPGTAISDYVASVYIEAEKL